MAVSLATLLMLVDFAAVSVTLPAVPKTMSISFPELLWVLEAFVVTLAAFILCAGYIADRRGRRGMFLTGLAVFAIGSMVGGVANGPVVLIAGRVVQGLGGALIFATGSPLLLDAFARGTNRAALAVWGTVTGLGVAISPLVGGAITGTLGWQWLFRVNVPLALVALFFGWRAAFNEPLRNASRGRPDWRAVGLFIGAIELLIIGLVRTTASTNLTGSWSANGVVALFVCSALLMVAFVAVEIVSPEPFLDMALFRQRTFTGSAIAALGLSAAVWGSLLFIVLYMAYDLKYSVFAIGIRLLLLTGMTLPFLPVANWLDRALPVKVLICGGLTLVAGGLFWMAQVTTTSGWDGLMPGLVLAGVGLELVNPRLAMAAAATVQPSLAAVASRASSTFRLVGTATGVAVLGSLFATRMKDHIANAFSSIPQLIGDAPHVTSLVLQGQSGQAVRSAPFAVRLEVAPIVAQGFVAALHSVLIVAALVALASAVLALSVRSADIAGPPAGPLPAPAPVASSRPLLGRDTPAHAPLAPEPVVGHEHGVAGNGHRPGGQAPVEEAPAEDAPVEAAPVPGTVAAAAPAPVAGTRSEAVDPFNTAALFQPPEPGEEEGTAAEGPEHLHARELTELLTSFLATVREHEVAAAAEPAPEEDIVASAAEGEAVPAGADALPVEAEAMSDEAEAATASTEAEMASASAEVEAEDGEAVPAEAAAGLARRGLRGEVNAMNGGAVGGATLTLIGPDGIETAQAMAEEDGTFVFTGVDDGTYTVVAAAPTFRPAVTMASVHQGEASTALTLLGIGALAVRVTHARDGSPLVAEVEVLNPDGGVAARCWTEPDGSATLRDLLEGPYEVNVDHPGYRPEPARLRVERGQTTVHDIAMTGLGHLYGAVSGPQGGWLPDVEVCLADSSGRVLAVAKTDDGGSYQFPALVEGEYQLSTASGATCSVAVQPGATVAADLTVASPG